MFVGYFHTEFVSTFIFTIYLAQIETAHSLKSTVADCHAPYSNCGIADHQGSPSLLTSSIDGCRGYLDSSI